MKKWLGILTIVFLASFICSAVLAGRVYYEDLKTYTDQRKEMLDVSSLEKIYIKSAVEVDICPTEGEPYAEFTQKFVDLVGLAPKYELKVEKRDKSTYITLQQIEDMMISLGVREDEARLVIYLPKTQIQQLNVENTSYYYNQVDTQTIDLEGINIREINMDLIYAEVRLNGVYEKVNLELGHGSLDFISEQPVQLYTSGRISEELEGKFENITIRGNGGDININSEEACNVQIDTYNSMINLKGSYTDINLSGNANNVDLRSETPCKLLTEGQDNVICGNGAFEEMNFKESITRIQLQTMMIPTKLLMSGCQSGTSMKLTLPANIPGFKVHYINNSEEITEEDINEDYFLASKTIKSDFKVEKYISYDNELNFGYGDESMPITLPYDSDITLDIIEGDYSSAR